ncbi:MAG TPA: hypothetical protein VHB21_24865, partial [Minicystis sp.]|nr:hypothetical protein [Minicystis sp.]
SGGAGAASGSGGAGGACGGVNDPCGGRTCCKGLTCAASGVCEASGSGGSGGSGGAPACVTCAGLLQQQQGTPCPGSNDRLAALLACACDTSQPCGAMGGPCGPTCTDGSTGTQACSDCVGMQCQSQLGACESDPGCLTCDQMLMTGDADAHDACPGTARDDDKAFFACACGAAAPCQAVCATYCADQGASQACSQCLSSQSSGCGATFLACVAN